MKTLREFIRESEDKPGIYGAHVSHGKGAKRVSKYHEVYAKSHAEAEKIIFDRHADEHKIPPMKRRFPHVNMSRTTFMGSKGAAQQRADDEALRKKPPNRGSKEQEFRDAAQHEYDTMRRDGHKSYTGD